MSEFDELLRAAEKTFDMDSTRDMEPYFEPVLDFVVTHPQYREEFESRFVGMLEGFGGSDLLEYCMHELRWSGVLEAASWKLSNETSERAKTWWRLLIDAYGDDWSGAELYRRFSSDRVVN